VKCSLPRLSPLLFPRQQDNDFVQLLNDCRSGSPSEKTIARLKAAQRKSADAQGVDSRSIVATKLFSRNNDVDRVNLEELAKLKDAKGRTYDAIDNGEESFIRTLKKNCQVGGLGDDNKPLRR